MAVSDRYAAAGVDVVGLVASAGGLEALTAVLRGLPADFPAAVVVAQHLGEPGSVLVKLLERRIALPVAWARHGGPIDAGAVTVCPPRSRLEVLPDRTCAVTPREIDPDDRPLDALLGSLADSVGSGAAGVVLTGLGSDGARGVSALREAGGVVIAQDEATAEQPAMPRAAAQAGADLVLPLHEIARVVRQLVAGEPLPRSTAESDAISATFGDEGAVAASAREVAWAGHPLGAVRGWSPALRAFLRLAMDSPDPTAVLWGAQYLTFVNEAAVPLVGGERLARLGRPCAEVFPEAWETAGPLDEQVLAGGRIHQRRAAFPLREDGRLRDRWFDISSTPLREMDGAVAGLQTVFFERTREVLAARRLATLNRLSTAPAARDRRDALREACGRLADAADVPFALAYLVDHSGVRAVLAGATGVDAGGPMAPQEVRLAPGTAWPLRAAAEARAPIVVDDLGARFPGHGVGDDATTADRAVLHPLRDEAEDRLAGVLVLGVGPRLRLDEAYREFLALAGETVAAKVAESHARQRERVRGERLAELDRAKTEFFSNVSHEFRTPLTLMLGPLDAAVERADEMPDGIAADIAVAARNARRLLRLTDSLLDFSRMEAGWMRARLAPTDLAECTREIVAPFAGAAAAAGLTLRAAIEPVGDAVWVDVEMWEKIVAHLLSNALKFTLEGEVVVTLRALPKHVELVVRDTGIGIPDDDLPFIFERFHRVRGSRGRTHEGAGIGLALVHALVRRHHGRIRVTSAVGSGTTFTVWIARARRPLREEDDGAPPAVGAVAAAMAEEASLWQAGEDDLSVPALTEATGDPTLDDGLRRLAPGARILVADDNADMRSYLARLLGAHWDVEAVADGRQALERVRERRPDLVLADVAMPELDGSELLAAIRGDDDLHDLPVVLVTARAGEGAAVEGLLAGADDYIAKPFSTRELVARVGGQLELDRLRRRVARRQAFLLRLADELRPLADPQDIMGAAARVLAGQLGVERVSYGEVTPDGQALVVERDHAAAGAASLVGTYRFADFPIPVAGLAEGRTFVAEDVPHDDRFSPEGKAVFAQIGSAATCSVPLVKQGRFVANLNVHSARPRPFGPDDVALVEEVAERTWAAVERARAEASLRASQDRLRAMYDGTHHSIGLVATDGTLVEANRAFLEWAGGPREEVVGRPVWESPWSALAPGGPGRLREAIGRAAAGELVREDPSSGDAPGGPTGVDLTLHPVRGDDGDVTLIVLEAREVAGRMRAGTVRNGRD